MCSPDICIHQYSSSKQDESIVNHNNTSLQGAPKGIFTPNLNHPVLDHVHTYEQQRIDKSGPVQPETYTHQVQGVPRSHTRVVGNKGNEPKTAHTPYIGFDAQTEHVQ